MSKVKVSLKDGILTIKKDSIRPNKTQEENIEINKLFYCEEYTSNIKTTTEEEENKVFLLHEIINNNTRNMQGNHEDSDIEGGIQGKDAIIVYSIDGEIKYSYCDIMSAYKKLVKFKYKVVKLSLNRRRLKIILLGYFINKYKLKLEDKNFYVDQTMSRDYDVKEYKAPLSKIGMIKNNLFKTFTFKTKDLLQDDSEINGSTRVSVTIDGNIIDYRVGIKNKKIKNKKYYYTPMKCKYIKNYAMHYRRTLNGNLVFVKRLKEPIENTIKFRFLENKFISFCMYKIGKKYAKNRKQKVNLLFEKFAAKSEEGVFELCEMCNKNSTSKNYFIIDKNSEDYERIKDNKNVVAKYSLKYYWLVYSCNSFIASETPGHINILRSNNKYLRRATYDKKFVFLQHGIIYMKNLGVNSAFNKGREQESDYMVVSSEKEREVVSEMLGYNEEQLLKTGLGMFSTVDYKHINQESEDYVTIMLTWKPYEEHLYNFEESSYYQNVIKICELLKKYIDTKKILIIAHPKAQSLIMSTDLKDSLWDKPISEALKKTKLLITDYSSVCYNTFYRGGAVIFYQEDIVKYEEDNGPLIPSEEEYVGKRAFNIEELENIIKDTIKENKIDLSVVRTPKFEENYKTINEFSDGKNIDRICESLKKLKMI